MTEKYNNVSGQSITKINLNKRDKIIIFLNIINKNEFSVYRKSRLEH